MSAPVEVNEEQKEDEITQEQIDKEEAELRKKLDFIKQILNLVMGGQNISAKIDPILNPQNLRTTSFLKRGDIDELLALNAFCQIAPFECKSIIGYQADKLSLMLNLDGFSIDKAIELGKALTIRDTAKSSTYYESAKPTDIVKDKE